MTTFKIRCTFRIIILVGYLFSRLFPFPFHGKSLHAKISRLQGHDTESNPMGQLEYEKNKIIRNVGSALLLMTPTLSRALSIPINDNIYRKGLLNIQADDFWYPPYMIGMWNTTLSFSGASFTKAIPYEVLSINENLPGFSPYSVIFAADMGKDVNYIMRFPEVDSHPREDHPFNIRQLLGAFSPETVVDEAPYAFQRGHTIFYSPSNHWTIKYHDPIGSGIIQLLTRKRNINIDPGSVETIEFFQQKHTRQINGTDNIKPIEKVIISDYALVWNFSIPASARDEFVTATEAALSPTLVGTLDILVYLQPSNDLYLKASTGKPAGRFSYKVNMERIPTNMSSNVYPIIFYREGPVELDKFFGY